MASRNTPAPAATTSATQPRPSPTPGPPISGPTVRTSCHHHQQQQQQQHRTRHHDLTNLASPRWVRRSAGKGCYYWCEKKNVACCGVSRCTSTPPARPRWRRRRRRQSRFRLVHRRPAAMTGVTSLTGWDRVASCSSLPSRRCCREQASHRYD